MWERACSRRGRHIQHLRCLTHRFREQARSHRFCAYLQDVGNIDHSANIQHKNHVSCAPRLITHPRGQFV
ncbi:hypothetical protein C0J26_15005 [Pseudomonas baetica]|nr:hypothetical protein C0J26_15005 [Pseudomonas baetica]